jgi:hypothetical protein
MMPMPNRRKGRKLEKVKNFCRTATARKFMPTRRNKSDHACAIPAGRIRADLATAPIAGGMTNVAPK